MIDSIKKPEDYKDLKPLSVIAYLNANMAWKYKPQVALNDESAREVIVELRKLSGMAKETPKKTDELSEDVEKTLQEIVEKRKDLPEEGE